MWKIVQTEEFNEWYFCCDRSLQDEMGRHFKVLTEFGPGLGRPQVDTLYGSRIKNLKELRIISLGREVRVFFCFDIDRSAVLLIGGIKSGKGEKRFYKRMIRVSEKIYLRYLKRGNGHE